MTGMIEEGGLNPELFVTIWSLWSEWRAIVYFSETRLQHCWFLCTVPLFGDLFFRSGQDYRKLNLLCLNDLFMVVEEEYMFRSKYSGFGWYTTWSPCTYWFKQKGDQVNFKDSLWRTWMSRAISNKFVCSTSYQFWSSLHSWDVNFRWGNALKTINGKTD